ncbi:MAG: response regulator, partial [Gallionella sp.]|nr:response regulator [Gallionella sp.]
FDDATRNLLVEMVTNVDYAIGVYENEVRRKLLEESLRNSEDKYRKAFQTSPDAINITRMQDGLFLDVNSGFERMFGFRRGEVIGKTSVELKVWRNPADRQRLLDALNQTGVCESLEADFNAKQGDVINGLMSGAIVHINGEDCIITMTRDITEQRRVLAALSNTADELVRSNIRIEEERAQLAQRVEERTLQLRLANKAKDSFLATMSHEIRTPLGGLLGMMELLGLSRLNSEQRGILAAAQQSGNSLLRIVNDILDWSKIEAGKLELAPSAASIAEMLKTVANTYSQIASENGISIEVEIDSRLSPAHLFDPLRVSQILDNFTSNALKFTEHGNVQLAAYLLTRHDGRETIRFSVRDSGVGISAEHQARLFQQYEQASAETARMYGGTGLGLAICRRLAELMGGTLGVESTVGVGSLFSLSVDLLVANPVLQPAAPDGNRALAADDSPLVTTDQSVTVLIVDDHPLNRMLLKQQLGMLGLRVEAAADGVEALSLWQNKDRHFDLIITDCHMPVMDGYDLTYRIRDFERQTGGKRIPIIAWTANVLTEEAEHCHAAGMDDLLTKPTELAELRAMLLKWLLKAGVLV